MIQYVCDRCHKTCSDKDEMKTVTFTIGDKQLSKDICDECFSFFVIERFDFEKWRDDTLKVMTANNIRQADIARTLKSSAAAISQVLCRPPRRGVKTYAMKRLEDAILHIMKGDEQT